MITSKFHGVVARFGVVVVASKLQTCFFKFAISTGDPLNSGLHCTSDRSHPEVDKCALHSFAILVCH